MKMNRLLKIIVGLVLIITSAQFASADLTKNDIEEIRAIVREEVSREVGALRNEMNAKIDGLKDEMNARFEEVDTRFKEVDTRFKEVDTRFKEIDKRFEGIYNLFHWLYILLSGIIALIGIMVSSVLWLAKQDRPVTIKHYKEIKERESYLEKELQKLRKDLGEHLVVAHSV